MKTKTTQNTNSYKVWKWDDVFRKGLHILMKKVDVFIYYVHDKINKIMPLRIAINIEEYPFSGPIQLVNCVCICSMLHV